VRRDRIWRAGVASLLILPVLEVEAEHLTICMEEAEAIAKVDDEWLRTRVHAGAVSVNTNPVRARIYHSYSKGGYVYCQYRAEEGPAKNLVYRYPCEAARRASTGHLHAYVCQGSAADRP
jgi:hypothetical protein